MNYLELTDRTHNRILDLTQTEVDKMMVNLSNAEKQHKEIPRNYNSLLEAFATQKKLQAYDTTVHAYKYVVFTNKGITFSLSDLLEITNTGVGEEDIVAILDMVQ